MASNIPIEDINITPKSEFIITREDIWISGCSVFPNNKAIFVDSENNNIILLKENGEKEKDITVSPCPWDVTIIDDNTVAVSTLDGVTIINITTNNVEKTINTGICQGLKYYKGSLFCCVRDKGVLSVDLTSSAITTIIQDRANSDWFYCTVYNDRIYTTRSAHATITCYTMGGDKVWEFKDPSVIDCPLGIAVDNSFNVYVASFSKHSVIVLSPDGQRHRTLLTQKDGIYRPWALHFDRSKNQLLVGNEHGKGLLFSI